MIEVMSGEVPQGPHAETSRAESAEQLVREALDAAFAADPDVTSAVLARAFWADREYRHHKQVSECAGRVRAALYAEDSDDFRLTLQQFRAEVRRAYAGAPVESVDRAAFEILALSEHREAVLTHSSSPDGLVHAPRAIADEYWGKIHWRAAARIAFTADVLQELEASWIDTDCIIEDYDDCESVSELAAACWLDADEDGGFVADEDEPEEDDLGEPAVNAD